MSEKVKSCLTNLKLDYLLETFEKNNIKDSTLQLLTPELISRLIPAVGDQAIFLHYWETKIKGRESKSLIPHETASVRAYQIDSDLESDIENEESQAENGLKRKADHPIVTDKSKRNKLAEIAVPNLANKVFAKESLTPVLDLLKSSESGRRVITILKEEGSNKSKYRGRLCDIIVSYLNDNNIYLTNEIAADFANQIEEIFPTESALSYYMPPVAKKVSKKGKSEPAKGKLFSKWRNVKYEEKKIKRIIETEAENENDVDEINIDSELQENVNWLQKNQSPWDQVLENWKKTANYRRSLIKNIKENNISRIFSEWSLYKHANGADLVQIDYEALQLTNNKINIQIWKNFIQVILKTSSVAYRDETGKSLLDYTKSSDWNDTTVAASFLLLAHLFPPRQVKKVKNLSIKSSIGEAKESLIKLVSIPGDMSKNREEVQAKANELMQPIQPYLILIGSLQEVSQIFVCLDDVYYKANCVLEAIDICFKIFYTFDLKYPMASEHLWHLIEFGIYGLNISNTCTSIQNTLKALKVSRINDSIE